MSRIDTSEWISFSVASIFETQKNEKHLQVPTGGSIKKKDLEEGDIPRITVTNLNNGIFGYYKDRPTDSNYRVYENFISISFLGTVFYQPNKASLDMKVHCLKPLTHKLNKYTGEFLVTSILASLKESSYANQISSTVLPNLEIILPVDDLGNPDWTYMEKYIKNLEKKVASSLMKLKSVNNVPRIRANVSEWGYFHIYDEELFTIDSGTKLDRIKMDMSVEEISFVGRSNVNNGITAKVKKMEGIEPYKKGYLTLALGGAYLGSCFVQPDEFYTSQNVVVLIPNHDMSFNVKQFIASTIFVESQNNYQAFIKELNAHIKRNFKIKLPVISEGVPDWDYMEQYMQQMQKKAEQLINCIV